VTKSISSHHFPPSTLHLPSQHRQLRCPGQRDYFDHGTYYPWETNKELYRLWYDRSRCNSRENANSPWLDTKPSFSRVKRQARGEIFNDENENPFLSPIAREDIQDPDSMEIDELSKPITSKSTPAKHGPAGGRIPLSPSKFRTRNGRRWNSICLS
jgi:hypothetical protein